MKIYTLEEFNKLFPSKEDTLSYGTLVASFAAVTGLTAKTPAPRCVEFPRNTYLRSGTVILDKSNRYPFL